MTTFTQKALRATQLPGAGTPGSFWGWAYPREITKILVLSAAALLSLGLGLQYQPTTGPGSGPPYSIPSVKLAWSGLDDPSTPVNIYVRGDGYPGPYWRRYDYQDAGTWAWPSGTEDTADEAAGIQGVAYLSVPGPGTYQFYVQSDPGSSRIETIGVPPVSGNPAQGPALTVTPGTDSITASWDVPSYAGGGAICCVSSNGYDADQIWEVATNVAGTGTVSYTFQNLTPGDTYYLTLLTSGFEVNSNGPDIIQVLSNAETQLQGSNQTPPAAPAFAHAVYTLPPNSTGGLVNLSWANSSNNETGFEIYRSFNGGAYSLVGTTGADTTTFSDKLPSTLPAPSPGGGYNFSYRIIALNGTAKSKPTTVTITIPALAHAVNRKVKLVKIGRPVLILVTVIWDEYLFDQFGNPMVGYAIAEKIKITGSRWCPGATIGAIKTSAVIATGPGGWFSDLSVQSFIFRSGYVAFTQDLIVGGRTATFHTMVMATGLGACTLRAIFN